MICPEHDGLCAYTGTEPDRCPICHASWEVIIRTDWHTCEQWARWDQTALVTRARIERARQLREAWQAGQNVQQERSAAHPAAITHTRPPVDPAAHQRPE